MGATWSKPILTQVDKKPLTANTEPGNPTLTIAVRFAKLNMC